MNKSPNEDEGYAFPSFDSVALESNIPGGNGIVTRNLFLREIPR
ncbi:hypothetical protein [Salmonella phage vB-SalM-SJ3]|uniref:Uncharacterized protein n=1 Tax=Salmonella phage vB-SalM-SJ3 TaxID=1446492 RepID=X4YTV4_9CAUD|nr:hypothetical protein FF15_gp031 [Salmonella phage vB-SalM-SJ3]AHV82446.1 hypothetical protein [Salmonella phage vB-SalM-SJ3]